jgi:hypothetical protein
MSEGGFVVVAIAGLLHSDQSLEKHLLLASELQRSLIPREDNCGRVETTTFLPGHSVTMSRRVSARVSSVEDFQEIRDDDRFEVHA